MWLEAGRRFLVDVAIEEAFSEAEGGPRGEASRVRPPPVLATPCLSGRGPGRDPRFRPPHAADSRPNQAVKRSLLS